MIVRIICTFLKKVEKKIVFKAENPDSDPLETVLFTRGACLERGAE